MNYEDEFKKLDAREKKPLQGSLSHWVPRMWKFCAALWGVFFLTLIFPVPYSFYVLLLDIPIVIGFVYCIVKGNEASKAGVFHT